MINGSSIDNTSMSKIKEDIANEREEEERMKEKIPPKKLLKFTRFFTKPEIHPFDDVEWSTTRVQIKNLDNKVIFDHEVEHPVDWNTMAVRTCADKYFKTHDLENHVHGGERSVRDVIHRVACSVSQRGIKMEYFDEENGKILYDEICYLILNQMGAFNSPVFFNWGLSDVYKFKGNSNSEQWAIKDRDKEVYQQEFEYENSRGSACFITEVEDELINGKNGIYDWIKTEMSIFASGSGSGLNVSKIRGEDESITGGGKSSGLISFLEVADASAGAIKSGGKTRRSAKMLILNDNHPDLLDFIDWKMKEEFKARALMLSGYKQNWADKDGAYKIVQAQNGNNSIALTDDFMRAVINDENWELKYVLSGKTKQIIKARKIFDKIIEANWECGDPGVFFVDTINKWNTVPNTGKIEGSNPCIVGDTLIATADGRNAVSIKQLAEEGKDVPVYCLDDNKKLATRWMRNPRKTEANKKILKVIFNDGLVIRCTENHKFISKNGLEIEAKNLERGDSIESFNKWQTIPQKKEWVTECKNRKVSAEISRPSSPFRKYKDLKEAATNYNHRVISVELDGHEDVYNGTVDDFHNYAICHKTVTKTGMPKTHGVFTKNCGEFLYLNNTSCNLASLNLAEFLDKNKAFDIAAFKAAIEFFITSMEIIVGGSSYPSSDIAEMTKDTRPLGLGYCNMGGLIMILGHPYDSDPARSIISTITSLETSIAYAQSARIAAVVGPFNEYHKNKSDFMKVIKKHGEANTELKPRIKFAKQIHQAATESWAEAINLINRYGARNSQTVVVAPTGTIMFLMGTTNNGIEPSYSLCSYKLMSDGSAVELLCEEARVALKDLGYNEKQVSEINDYIIEKGNIEGAPHVSLQHYPIFDTANVDGEGTRCIDMMAHVNAIAAATPFISGGISKTINLPESVSKDDMWKCYVEGWKKGCKGLALYRSGSKWSQPLNSKNSNFKKETIKREIQRTKERLEKSDFRKKSPDDFWEFHRGLLTRKKAADRAISERLNFKIGSENVWMNVVRYPNNGVSEIWLEVGKENPTVNGLADTIGRICSIAIQYGVPIEALCSTMEGLQFSPAGFLRKNGLGIRSAKSLSDLTAQVLSKLHAEYNGLDSENIVPVWDNDTENVTEPMLISEPDQAKARGYSGTRCEKCGSWRTKGSFKCGVCLSCQTSYGACGG